MNDEPIIRELTKEDIWNGFLDTLDTLRLASNINKDRSFEIFEKIDANPDHIVAVAQLNKRIVGAATLLIEQKFIHNGGLVGHIEDVVVDKDFQKQEIGAKIISYLLEIAKNRGCYKTILDCTAQVRPFYEGLGFRHIAYELRFDHVDNNNT